MYWHHRCLGGPGEAVSTLLQGTSVSSSCEHMKLSSCLATARVLDWPIIIFNVSSVCCNFKFDPWRRKHGKKGRPFSLWLGYFPAYYLNPLCNLNLCYPIVHCSWYSQMHMQPMWIAGFFSHFLGIVLCTWVTRNDWARSKQGESEDIHLGGCSHVS